MRPSGCAVVGAAVERARREGEPAVEVGQAREHLAVDAAVGSVPSSWSSRRRACPAGPARRAPRAAPATAAGHRVGEQQRAGDDQHVDSGAARASRRRPPGAEPAALIAAGPTRSRRASRARRSRSGRACGSARARRRARTRRRVRTTATHADERSRRARTGRARRAAVTCPPAVTSSASHGQVERPEAERERVVEHQQRRQHEPDERRAATRARLAGRGPGRGGEQPAVRGGHAAAPRRTG